MDKKIVDNIKDWWQYKGVITTNNQGPNHLHLFLQNINLNFPKLRELSLKDWWENELENLKIPTTWFCIRCENLKFES